MTELSPELLVNEPLNVELAIPLGDLSVSSTMLPEGNNAEGYKDDPPQLGYDRSLALQ